METVEIDFRGRMIEAELARGFLEKSWGLSLRSEGKMLFTFSRPKRPAIDMLLLSVPLQLVWMDEKGEVLEVEKAEPWSKDPRSWKLYRPEKLVKYLLESTEFLEVEEGDRLEFEV